MDFPELRGYSHFALDTETTGLRYKVDTVFGFSVSTPDDRSWYWDIRVHPEAAEWLEFELRRYEGKVIAHNASFDYRMLNHTGVKFPVEIMDDTVIRACAIDEHLFQYSLDYLCKKYLGEEKETEIYRKMAELFGGLATRNVQMPRIKDAPPEVVSPYARRDTNLTLALWEWQQDEIKRQGIEKIAEFERGKMPTIIRAEMRGIRADLEYAEKAADKLTPIIDEKQDQLNKLAGEDINVNSNPQIKKMFSPKRLEDGSWATSSGEQIGTTPKGNPSLGAEHLRGMSDPKASLILDIRSVIKTRDTFLRGHVISHSVGERVYPTINQSKGEDGGTGTGRLSYSGPAMQQIPSKNKVIAAIVKPSFLPDEGQIWVDGDMASFEVRVFAHLIDNQKIIDAYEEDPGMDLHQFVADISGLPRDASYAGEANAKQLNLSMIFNSGNGATADKMGMSWHWETFTTKSGEVVTYKKAGVEAMRVINAYHNRIPGVMQLMNQAKQTAENRGHLYTRSGRRLRFPKGYKSYKASGILIQATSADLNKENWTIIEEQLGNEGHLILNTHDSYSMSMPEDWRPHWERVKNAIERPRLRVPLVMDLNGYGCNWWAALQGDN